MFYKSNCILELLEQSVCCCVLFRWREQIMTVCFVSVTTLCARRRRGRQYVPCPCIFQQGCLSHIGACCQHLIICLHYFLSYIRPCWLRPLPLIFGLYINLQSWSFLQLVRSESCVFVWCLYLICDVQFVLFFVWFWYDWFPSFNLDSSACMHLFFFSFHATFLTKNVQCDLSWITSPNLSSISAV